MATTNSKIWKVAGIWGASVLFAVVVRNIFRRHKALCDKASEGTVVSVQRSGEHDFTKIACEEIVLVPGLGVEGDSHYGATTQHLHDINNRSPALPNLRQVHLLPNEQLQYLASEGFTVPPGAIGENITIAGLDIQNFPVGTLLRIGDHALLSLTGERNPCKKIENYCPGLQKHFSKKNGEQIIRLSGVLAVVMQGGKVKAGDRIVVQFPPPPHAKLDKV